MKMDKEIQETAFVSALLNPDENEAGELLVGSQALKDSNSLKYLDVILLATVMQ